MAKFAKKLTKKNKMSCKYAVALSGGVDSSVVAAMLLDAGADVFGVTMDLHENSAMALYGAKNVCRSLGIKHFVLDVRKDFQKYVIDRFCEAYQNGLTPNPCALCNRDIKLNLLLKFAQENGADFLATGHYVRVEVDNQGKVLLKEALDLKKDQGYFLSLVRKECLRYVKFPLGELSSKSETRQLAEKYGLCNSQQKDSQDACFIKKNYREYIKDFLENTNAGDIVNVDGVFLGRHNGISAYTIGQRKGLGISNKKPLYVVGINKNLKQIVVDDCLPIITQIVIENVNWIAEIEKNVFDAKIKIRSTGEKLDARLKKMPDGKVQIDLHAMGFVAPSQVCAIYIGDILLGGGTICSF